MTERKKNTGKSDEAATERDAVPPELESEDEAEQASIDSFPASDPPAYTPAHAENPTALPIPRNPRRSNGPNQKR